jgi:hypothetical protein
MFILRGKDYIVQEISRIYSLAFWEGKQWSSTKKVADDSVSDFELIIPCFQVKSPKIWCEIFGDWILNLTPLFRLGQDMFSLFSLYSFCLCLTYNVYSIVYTCLYILVIAILWCTILLLAAQDPPACPSESWWHPDGWKPWLVPIVPMISQILPIFRWLSDYPPFLLMIFLGKAWVFHILLSVSRFQLMPKKRCKAQLPGGDRNGALRTGGNAWGVAPRVLLVTPGDFVMGI